MPTIFKDQEPMTLEQKADLIEKNLVDLVYNAAYLEGVRVSFVEARAFILDGVEPSGPRPIGLNKIKNLKTAYLKLEEEEMLEEPTDLNTLCSLNRIVNGRGVSEEPGRVRRDVVTISGTEYVPEIPDPYIVNNTIRDIVEEKKSFKVFSGTKSRYLAEKICQSLGCELGDLSITHFADGEFEVCFEESIRGRDVFLVQSTFPNADNLMELLLMIDAAKRASAKTVNAVIPYFGWARQDRKSKPRVSIAAKLVADMLSVAGISRMITMDLHADQEQGFFNVPVDHLYASSVLLPYIQSLNLENLVIATPDVGGTKRASTYSKFLNCPLVLCNKSRRKANEVASMEIIGDVTDANVVLVDDMVDTAGTITKAADLMKSKGARTVRAIASHCVMSGPASERVQNSALEELVFTDSIPYNNACSKVKELSIADLIANTIRCVLNNESISKQYLI